MTPIMRLVALGALPLLAIPACGGDDAIEPGRAPVTTPASQPPATSGDAAPVPPGTPDIDAARRRAASLLGTTEANLPDDVRVSRRGDERYALTADHAPGRLTVELDPGDDGAYVVTSVVIETEDGSEVMNVERLLEDATSALGTPEADLDPHWRIARRGEETYMLTRDYVVGRFTVELDDDGTGTFVVSAVTVELPDRVERITAEG